MIIHNESEFLSNLRPGCIISYRTAGSIWLIEYVTKVIGPGRGYEGIYLERQDVEYKLFTTPRDSSMKLPADFLYSGRDHSRAIHLHPSPYEFMLDTPLYMIQKIGRDLNKLLEAIYGQ